MLKLTAVVSTITLLAACAKKNPPDEPNPPEPPHTTVTASKRMCQATANRIKRCTPALSRALRDALLKYKAPLKDMHSRGATRRMALYYVNAFYRSSARAFIITLAKQAGTLCSPSQSDPPDRSQFRALRACAKTQSCKALGRCLVKHGAYSTLINMMKKRARQLQPTKPTPLNLLYHWGYLGQLAMASAMYGCGCHHWMTGDKKLVGSKGGRPATQKPIPPPVAKCKLLYQRPEKCANALWSEAVDRSRKSSTGSLHLKDTSINEAEALGRIRRLTATMLKKLLPASSNKPQNCPLDGANQMPKDVRPVHLLLVRCNLEKTCKGYTGCLRRAADMP